jgi:hypothetical protein
MKRFSECEELTTAPIKSLQTKGSKSKIIFENPKRLELCIIDIDKCPELSEETRCDYVLTAEAMEEEFYIELKGRDIEHGFEQIQASIKTMSSDPYKHPKICFIVSTRCTKTVRTKIPNMKIMLKTKYNAKLIVQNTPHTYTIEPSS